MTDPSAALALSRRGMLTSAAALATASCCPAFASDIDVVVIGAGAAGIGAAQMLASLGRTCLVVEAANRIGGRALTDDRSFGVPFDIGCAWIHAAHSNPFYGFALANGFHLKYHSLELNEIYYRGQREDALVADEHKAEFMIGEAIDATAKAGKDEPASEVMPTRASPLQAAATYAGPMDAAVDFENESVFDHAAEAEAEYDPNYLVKEGFGALVQKIGQRGMRVRLSTPVQSIRYDGKGVSVQTPRGPITAKAAIVTVSVGVLAKGSIAFSPALPVATQEAIHDLPMGLLTKIPLLIPGHGDCGIKPYDNVLDENPDPKAKDDFYFLAWPWNSDLMVGFVGGDYAWQLAKEPEADVIGLASDRLAGMFGSAIKGKIRKGLVTPWANNPLTLGAYTAVKPGHHEARAALRQPVAGRLFFAGEAVAENGLFATCGGAYLSGESAARAAHKAMA